MTITQKSKSEFIAETLEKYGFGKRHQVARPVPKKQSPKPFEKSILELTIERFPTAFPERQGR